MKRVFILLSVLLMAASIRAASLEESIRELLSTADSLQTAGRSELAVEKLETALDSVTAYMPGDSLEAAVRYAYGYSLYAMGRGGDAVEQFEKCIRVYDMLFGSGSVPAARSMMQLAWVYNNSQFSDSAIALFSKARDILTEAYGNEHVDVAFAVNGLGKAFEIQGRFGEAREAYEFALEVRKKVLGPDSGPVSNILWNLSNVAKSEGDFKKAAEYTNEVLRIRKVVYGEVHPLVADAWNAIAWISMEDYDFENASSAFNKALRIYREFYGTDNASVSDMLCNLATMYWNWNKLEPTVQYYDSCICIRDSIFGEYNQFIASPLLEMSDALFRLGRFHEEEIAVQRAERIAEDSAEVFHPGTLAFLKNLIGAYYWKRYDFEKADKLLSESIRMYEDFYGPDYRHLAWPLQNLARVKNSTNDIASALRLYQRCLAVRERAYGENGGDVAPTLSEIGWIYMDLGDIDRAEPLFNRGNEIAKEVWGEDNTYYLLGLEGVGEIYLRRGETEKALACLQLQNDLVSRGLTTNRDITSRPTREMGTLYRGQGDFVRAESCYVAALDILGDERFYNRSIIWTTTMLAATYSEQGKFSKADSLFKSAVELANVTPISKPWEYAWAHEAYSDHMRRTGDADSALSLAVEGVRERHGYFQNSSMAVSDNDLRKAAGDLRWSASKLASCVVGVDDKESQSDILPLLLLCSKGPITEEISDRKRFLKGGQAPQMNQLLSQLGSVRAAGSEMMSRLLNTPTNSAYPRVIDSLKSEERELEREIALYIAENRPLDRLSIPTTKEMLAELPVGSVGIEFVLYNFHALDGSEDESRYLGLSFCSDSVMEIADLGPSAAIDSLVQSYRTHLQKLSSAKVWPSNDNTIEFKRIASQLYSSTLGPLVGSAAPTAPLVIAPDGALNLVSFSTLVDDNEQYLVENSVVHTVSTLSDLMLERSGSSMNRTFLALGDPDFDSDFGETETEPAPLTVAAANLEFPAISMRTLCLDESGIDAKRLAGTAAELNRIDSIWNDAGIADSVVLLIGREASETQFRRNAAGCRYIHLSTHGFFLGSCQREYSPNESNPLREIVGENPMLSSGLLLAGCNNKENLSQFGSTNDGILSAYEVAELDLEGTEMVVLSACESGAGKVEDGEGVYGLRRAFQLAGAKTVVSALWPVDDQTTADMMAELYKESDLTISERIRIAQLKKIQELREEGFADHPLLWGAWIGQGDWR